ncbi:MAG: hypothetical protein MUD01_09675 [Chloroflexaceae bacterium]|nr:hypothetical protein [Chloroflexaceae bacterium]
MLSSALAVAWGWLDRNVLDRVVDGTGHVTSFLGRLNFLVDDTLLNDGPDAVAHGTVATGEGVRRSETGKAQDYVSYIFIGVVLVGLVYIYWLRG